jgi:hypothetical protein
MTKRILILSEQDRACLLEMIERAQSSWRTYQPVEKLLPTLRSVAY